MPEDDKGNYCPHLQRKRKMEEDKMTNTMFQEEGPCKMGRVLKYVSEREGGEGGLVCKDKAYGQKQVKTLQLLPSLKRVLIEASA